MNELRNAIQKHLGIMLPSDEVTHYQLLDIPPDSDPATIQRALKIAADKWNRSDRKSNPEAAKKVAGLIKEAQATLLVADKRRAYDSALGLSSPVDHADLIISSSPSNTSISEKFASRHSTFGSNATAVHGGLGTEIVKEIAWDAPFDVTLDLPIYEVRDFGSPEERWAEIVKATSIDPYLRSYSAATATPTSTQSLLIAGNRTLPTSTSKPNSSGSITDRAAMLRKKRQRQQVFVAFGLVGSAFLLLGAAGIYYYNNQEKLARANADKDPVSETSSSHLNVAKDPFLPGIPPNEGMPGKQTAPRPSNFRSNLPSISMDPEKANGSEGMPSSENSAAGQMPPGEMLSTSDANMMGDSKAASDSDNSMMSESKNENTMDLSEPAKRDPKWIDAMNNARAAIRKADFETFKAEIEKALPLNMTDEQEDLYKRLDQFGQLYQIAVTAMKDARKSLRGTEALPVGKGKVNIVEVKDESLIIRKEGANVEYSWDKLPPGIAMAIANFSLSETDPTDLAARAVYLSLGQEMNEITKKTVQGLWEKSLGKGSILSDLNQAMEDTYE